MNLKRILVGTFLAKDLIAKKIPGAAARSFSHMQIPVKPSNMGQVSNIFPVEGRTILGKSYSSTDSPVVKSVKYQLAQQKMKTILRKSYSSTDSPVVQCVKYQLAQQKKNKNFGAYPFITPLPPSRRSILDQPPLRSYTPNLKTRNVVNDILEKSPKKITPLPLKKILNLVSHRIKINGTYQGQKKVFTLNQLLMHAKKKEFNYKEIYFNLLEQNRNSAKPPIAKMLFATRILSHSKDPLVKNMSFLDKKHLQSNLLKLRSIIGHDAVRGIILDIRMHEPLKVLYHVSRFLERIISK